MDLDAGTNELIGGLLIAFATGVVKWGRDMLRDCNLRVQALEKAAIDVVNAKNAELEFKAQRAEEEKRVAEEARRKAEREAERLRRRVAKEQAGDVRAPRPAD